MGHKQPADSQQRIQKNWRQRVLQVSSELSAMKKRAANLAPQEGISQDSIEPGTLDFLYPMVCSVNLISATTQKHVFSAVSAAPLNTRGCRRASPEASCEVLQTADFTVVSTTAS